MRVAQVCPYSWDAPGGVQAHVRHLSRHLLRRGHEVLVLAPGLGSAEAHVRIIGRPLGVRFNGSVVPLCLDPASPAAVREALEEFRPDVVHVHEPLAPSTSLLATLYARSPVVATFHSYYGHDTIHAHLYTTVAPLLRPVWDRLDYRIAVSNAAAACVASRMGSTPHVVPNGANVELFSEARPASLPPGRKLLFVSRLEPRKGFRVALRAFAELAERFPDLLLVVVGDGRDRVAVRRLAPALRARVVMLGSVSHAALPTFYAAADVFVASATGRESFGIILVEAMAAGLPVVASDLTGYREVVRPGIEGLLVPPRDPVALAAAVARILEHPPLARRLGEAGRERARHFSWERIAARVEAAYHEVIGPRRTALRRLTRRVGAA